ncbi:PKD domain-containing protein [Rapidithrix thailandica]|uniref:PKD domain-containing protein n=1 Tax=Rapidithrix thailandica TaxID=413964 RepID=A0AAW9S9K3_9BACT
MNSSPMIKQLIFGSLFLFYTCSAFAQSKSPRASVQEKPPLHRTCGFEYQTSHSKKELGRIEAFLRSRIYQTTQLGKAAQGEEVYQIPIIVHIVHNGEAVGEGTNISAAQVYSQFDVLNEDFRRKNADATQTPDEFKAVAADARIEFVPARVDPQGNFLKEPGIHRVHGHKASWSLSEAQAGLQPAIYWDPDQYANVYTLSLQGFLGYAQFPSFSGLDGLSEKGGSAQRDGILINYQYFGRTPANPFQNNFNKGRTLTHEMGHWLGLIHIWGESENNCEIDDFCEDTPRQSVPHYGCKDEVLSSCGSSDMFQNFLDYSNDACMNLFTNDQVQRMHTVMEVASRRKVLLNSRVATTKNVFANLNVKSRKTCWGGNLQFQSLSKAKNSQNLSLKWHFPGGTPEYSNEVNPAVQYLSKGTFDVRLIAQAGGESDTLLLKEYIEVVDYSQQAKTNLSQDFEGVAFPPENWTVTDNAWQKAVWAGGGATFVNNYQNDYGNVDASLLSPVLDTRLTQGLKLEFQYAYALWAGRSDSLAIYMEDLCTGEKTLLWKKGGQDLATTSTASSGYTPSSEAEWKTGSLIMDVESSEWVRVVFQNIGNFGNNLFLDNIQINTFEGPLAEFTSSQTLTCVGSQIQFFDQSKILGEDVLVEWNWEFPGGVPATSTEQNPVVTYPEPGVYPVNLNVRSQKNIPSTSFKENQVKIVPADEAISSVEADFETESLPEGWIADVAWNRATSGWQSSGSFRIDNFEKPGQKSGIYLPTLSTKDQAYLEVRFDLAYANRWLLNELLTDSLTIYYSTDCWATRKVIWTLSGAELATTDATSGKLSLEKAHWRAKSKIIALGALLEDQSEMQVMMECRSGGANPLWLDNVLVEAFQFQAPQAAFNFTHNGDTVFIGDVVQFWDRSELRPTAWKWTIEGAEYLTSTEQHPVITFSKPGIYSVTLEITNQAGSDILVKQEYLEVFFDPGKTLRLSNITGGTPVLKPSDEWGYVSGHNQYEDQVKAELFDSGSDTYFINSIDFGFAVIKAGSQNSTITFTIWEFNEAEKTAGAKLYSVRYSLRTIKNNLNNGQYTLDFENHLKVQGKFLVGIELSYGDPQDTVALQTSSFNSPPLTGWERNSQGNWFVYSDQANSWGENLAHWIFPTVSFPHPLSSGDQDAPIDLVLYPNPTSGIFYMKYKEVQILQIELFNLSGKRFEVPSLAPVNRFDLSGFPSGIYLLKIATDRGTVVKKLMLAN